MSIHTTARYGALGKPQPHPCDRYCKLHSRQCGGIKNHEGQHQCSECYREGREWKYD